LTRNEVFMCGWTRALKRVRGCFSFIFSSPGRSATIWLAAVVLAALSGARAQEPAPYRNPALPVEARVRDLLGRMTLEEKFWQLFMIPGDLDNPANDYSHGIFGLQIATARRQPEAQADAPALARAHAERINAMQRYFVEKTRLGIPILPFEEAVHGIPREGATVFPQAIALAAGWDTKLMARVADAIAEEARTRGIRDVLSPVVNIADDVRWGRVEETYGEDPYLASAMARVFVETFEKAGVVTTPKHFVANVGEGGRDSYPIGASERTLEERYYPPFLAAIRDAGARSVMTAYNSVDGSPATQNRRLLNGLLKGDWNFRGFVISDASATSGATVLHMTEASTASSAQDAFEAGLDVVFQSQYGQQRPYLEAFQRGLIAQEIIDASVARVLRAKFELGLFEHPYGDPAAAAAVNGSPEHRALAREAARAGIVLLKNDHGVLPLPKTLRRLAVIGIDAEEARLGGYSGPGAIKEPILAGLREALGSSANLRYVPGPGRAVAGMIGVPSGAFASRANGKETRGLSGEYFDNPRFEGAPRLTRTDPRIDFRWTLSSPGRGIPLDWYSVRWTGTLTAPAEGVRRIGVEANDGFRLYLDGKLVIDNWVKRSFGTRLAGISWAPGSQHDLRLEYFEATGNARIRLVWDAGVKDETDAQIEQAAAVAKESDAVIVVAGLEEGEFRDRARLGLPGRQEDLILAVAKSGKPVIVVLIGGSAITMSPWLDQVDAVLDAWYPGEAGGPAIADVLFGAVNPSGRLPITFPIFEGQLPLYYNHKPTGRGDDYYDLTGMPLFPFGFGLSYTSFEYSGLAVDPAEMRASETVRIRCRVRNSGSRPGDEVVQLYLRDVLASVARPVMELKGFQRIHLAQGESATLTFTLGPAELRMLDRDMKWVVEPGVFRVLIGASSKDIRLRGEFSIR
jgi:beta-glucosidase